jgi:hypothetical protein
MVYSSYVGGFHYQHNSGYYHGVDAGREPQGRILLPCSRCFVSNGGDGDFSFHTMKLLATMFALLAACATIARGNDSIARTNDIPVVSWMGWSSAVQELRFDRITTDDDWMRLWRLHTTSTGERPYVDFNKYMVVAVFIPGGSKAGYGIFAVPTYETADSITLEYGPAGYIVPKGKPKTLYGMFLLPYSPKRLIVKPFAADAFPDIKIPEHIFPAMDDKK